MAAEKPLERYNPVTYEGNLLPTGNSTAEATAMCCEFNANATLAAIGLANGSIKVVQPTASCPEVYRLNSKTCGKLPVTSVRFLGNYKPNQPKENILLATYATGFSVLWHVASGQVLSSQKEEGQSLAAAVAPGCETFCTSGSDGHVLIYDASTHTKLRTLEPSQSTTQMDGHVNRVFSARFHPANPSLLISTGWDDTIQFWDTRRPQALRKIPGPGDACGPHVCGDGLAIHPNNYNIVTASWRLKDTIQMWDYASGKLIKTLQPDLNIKAYSACWLGENHLMVGGSQQNKAVLIDASRDWVIASVYGMENGVYDIDYSSAGKAVAVAAGSTLYLGTWKKRSSSQEILVPR